MSSDLIQGAPRPGHTAGSAKRLGLIGATLTRWQRDRRLSWAVEASASSRFRGHEPYEVVGPPDVYPQLEDMQSSWTPLRPDAGIEWIELVFQHPVTTTRIYVFETCGPGAVFAATDLVDAEDYRRQGRRWHTLWQGIPERTPRDEAQLLVIDVDPPRELDRLRLWLDTRIDPSWNMIDAVALRSTEPVHERAVSWMSLTPVVRAKIGPYLRALEDLFL